MGHNYRTDKQAKLFVTYMAQNIRNKIAEKIVNSSYFAITCDSATDFSSKKQDSIRIRLAFNGAVSDHLIEFEAPGAPVNAEGIWEAILKVSIKLALQLTQLSQKCPQ